MNHKISQEVKNYLHCINKITIGSFVTLCVEEDDVIMIRSVYENTPHHKIARKEYKVISIYSCHYRGLFYWCPSVRGNTLNGNDIWTCCYADAVIVGVKPQ